MDFDPLDDTKLWPEERFPWLPVGRMVLNRNPVDYFSEVEQAAFGTGVLVDGLDFSDDKMLQGRTFSYSDTQRHRVGANYLQLPINSPKKQVATNRQFKEWERDELISNLVADLSRCDKRIQYAMITLAVEADEEYGRRLKEELASAAPQGESSQKPLGNQNGDQAPAQAVNVGHQADRY